MAISQLVSCAWPSGWHTCGTAHLCVRRITEVELAYLVSDRNVSVLHAPQLFDFLDA